MEEHFTIKKSIYLVAGGEALDLHNNYRAQKKSVPSKRTRRHPIPMSPQSIKGEHGWATSLQPSSKGMMSILLFIAVSLTGALALADSGGPYEAVPDLKKDEQPPVFSIPARKEPLRYFLQHKPELSTNRKLNEPDSYVWTVVKGHHASFRVLGHVRGREVYEVRYVSDSRIDQGLDYADAILIVARGFPAGPDQARFEPIYFSTGGISFDRRAEYLPDCDKYGAVKVTDSWGGTGPGRSRSIFLKGTEDFRFERFTPKS